MMTRVVPGASLPEVAARPGSDSCATLHVPARPGGFNDGRDTDCWLDKKNAVAPRRVAFRQ